MEYAKDTLKLELSEPCESYKIRGVRIIYGTLAINLFILLKVGQHEMSLDNTKSWLKGDR